MKGKHFLFPYVLQLSTSQPGRDARLIHTSSAKNKLGFPNKLKLVSAIWWTSWHLARILPTNCSSELWVVVTLDLLRSQQLLTCMVKVLECMVITQFPGHLNQSNYVGPFQIRLQVLELATARHHCGGWSQARVGWRSASLLTLPDLSATFYNLNYWILLEHVLYETC